MPCSCRLRLRPRGGPALRLASRPSQRDQEGQAVVVFEQPFVRAALSSASRCWAGGAVSYIWAGSPSPCSSLGSFPSLLQHLLLSSVFLTFSACQEKLLSLGVKAIRFFASVQLVLETALPPLTFTTRSAPPAQTAHFTIASFCICTFALILAHIYSAILST